MRAPLLWPHGRRPLSLAFGLALVAAACTAGDDAPDDPEVDDAAEAIEDTAETIEDVAALAEPPFAVGRRSLEAVDDSRPTDAVPGTDVEASPDRTIPIELVYPAQGEPAADSPAGVDITEADLGSDDAETDRVRSEGPMADASPLEGRYPLLVLGHGLGSSGEDMVFLAEVFAREGYVVALPTFPLSRDGVAYGDDYPNEPGDLSFAIDTVLALNDDLGDPLAGRVDGEHIAVGGLSQGGLATFGATYNSCCVDDRIDAAMPMAGGTLPIEGGDYDDPPATPLLVIHGAEDSIVPIAVGDAMFEIFGPPVYYLRFDEADHVSFLGGDDFELLTTAARAFLAAELRGEPDALAGLADTVAGSGRAEWRVKE